MKKTVLIILSTLFFQHVNSQTLSLSNLITLQNDSLNVVESFLLKKKWQFASSKEENDTTCAIVAFQSNVNKSDEIVQYLYSKSDNFQRLWYTTFSKKTYLQLIDQAKNLNFKFKENKVEGELLSNLYFRKGLFIIFRTFRLDTDNSKSAIMYRIELYKEDDYNKILPL
jgi:hypothetical protein